MPLKSNSSRPRIAKDSLMYMWIPGLPDCIHTISLPATNNIRSGSQMLVYALKLIDKNSSVLLTDSTLYK